MAGLQQSGKAKLVGLSNFEARDLVKLGPRAKLFAYNEVPYNMLEREYEGENLKANQRCGIRYLAYSPLAQGLLTGRFDEKTPITDRVRKNNELYHGEKFTRALKVVDAVRAVARQAGASMPQTALAWTLKQPNIELAIAGSYKPAQIRDAAQACDVQLTDAQLQQLTAASDEFVGGLEKLDVRT
jgi:aryl-alcohol dehydrogenase-like predicted oxidoreductase